MLKSQNQINIRKIEELQQENLLQIQLHERVMSEFRQKMNVMIDKMKTKEKELKEEIDELQLQLTTHWSIETLNWILEGEWTMDKWDKLVMLLNDY